MSSSALSSISFLSSTSIDISLTPPSSSPLLETDSTTEKTARATHLFNKEGSSDRTTVGSTINGMQPILKKEPFSMTTTTAISCLQIKNSEWGSVSTDNTVRKIPTPDRRQIAKPISPSEKDVQNTVQQFTKNYDLYLLEPVPTVSEFQTQLQLLCKNNKTAILSKKVGLDQYFFKFTYLTKDKLWDCDILRVFEKGATELLPNTEYTFFGTIEKASRIFAPLFSKEWESAETFNQQLKSLLIVVIKKNFICAKHKSFDYFLNGTQFANELTQLWENRTGTSMDGEISIGFEKNSMKYIFRFELNEKDGAIDFNCLRYTENTFQILLKEDLIKFNTIEQAIESLDPHFNKKVESEEVFFEQLKYLISTTPILLSTLESEIVLDQMRSKVESEDPNRLKNVFEFLLKMKVTTHLDIADQVLDMPIAALVLYYLNIIQHNEAPEVLNDTPDYALKAFQNIEGCASTPDQRTRAYLYAQMHMLFNALEIASKNNNLHQVIKCLKPLIKVAYDEHMPSSCKLELSPQLNGFVVTQHVLAFKNAKQTMKKTLNLP